MANSTNVHSGHVREERTPTMSAAGVTATPGVGGGPPARPRRPWWRRRWIPSLPRESMEEFQHATLEQLLALLEAARGELEAG
jgi:hypothetical protein